jgi:hypothetical protein
MQLANTEQPKALKCQKWKHAFALGGQHFQLFSHDFHEF